MQIYNAEEDGMEKRAIRQLQKVEAARPEHEFREKAYAVYHTDPGRERFGQAIATRQQVVSRATVRQLPVQNLGEPINSLLCEISVGC